MKHDFPTNDRVRLELDEDGVARVTMIRAEKRNALDMAMFDALLAAGHALFELSGLRCVVLAGEGKAFCAGLDLSVMQALHGEDAPRLPERTHGNANLFQQAALQWRKLPVPVIAAIHGACMGGGLQIAGGADMRVVSPDARLSVLELKWGIVPDMGHFALWRGHVREDVLRDLTYRHVEFSGSEAVDLGFATIADADPLARAMAMARDIASKSPHAVRAAKALFNRTTGAALDEVLLAESLEQHGLLGSRNQIEAVESQMAGRPPRFVDP
ncbi:MAG: crotonase/enoyl-CoA hydratase family protein [Novosphingobium sp.]